MVNVVLVNYKRPDNIGLIVSALRNQTVPVRITLIDAGNVGGVEVDVYVKLRENYGPWNRYATALLDQSEFTYFHDDDMIPGHKTVERFLSFRNMPFGVLGQTGRIWGYTDYNFVDVKASDSPVQVDNVVRGYFVRTENLSYLMRWRGLVAADDHSDDMWLCKSMAHLGGLDTFVIPASEDEKMDHQNLPEPFACSHANDWQNKRISTMKRIRVIMAGGVPCL